MLIINLNAYPPNEVMKLSDFGTSNMYFTINELIKVIYYIQKILSY